MRKAYPNEIFHSGAPIVYKGKRYDKSAENYLKNSGSAADQRAITAIINKITDPATKSMLKQASAESIVNWCMDKLKRKKTYNIDADAYVRANPEERLSSPGGKMNRMPKGSPTSGLIMYGLSERDMSMLMGYARRGLTYGTRPTYAEPDYQRAKIAAENDRYNRTYNTARMQVNANRRRKLTMGGRKDKA